MLAGQGDALTMALPDQRPLELRERTHHRQQQRCHRGVLTGERQLLFHELHPYAPGGQRAHQRAKVVEVAGQTVHRVHDHGVAVAHEPEHRLQLRPDPAAARRAAGERPVQCDTIELPVGFWSRLLTRV